MISIIADMIHYYTHENIVVARHFRARIRTHINILVTCGSLGHGGLMAGNFHELVHNEKLKSFTAENNYQKQ